MVQDALNMYYLCHNLAKLLWIVMETFTKATGDNCREKIIWKVRGKVGKFGFKCIKFEVHSGIHLPCELIKKFASYIGIFVPSVKQKK